ncbi:hypothetical protein GGS23DRAFT_369972 [Durotheca rogersii]|uniref:uncharacterized protein n=1 Tax=Durotheca rogersii TaxID=419775 RepID=UPI0022208FE3|nr:uncharacterized protein GGS23DRAFT_369972 [Durotheca rogersii]KAI5866111.1 hypothetical protein GGS23DRAFT_369972 [Durotheca rogersii]
MNAGKALNCHMVSAPYRPSCNPIPLPRLSMRSVRHHLHVTTTTAIVAVVIVVSPRVSLSLPTHHLQRGPPYDEPYDDGNISKARASATVAEGCRPVPRPTRVTPPSSHLREPGGAYLSHLGRIKRSCMQPCMGSSCVITGHLFCPTVAFWYHPPTPRLKHSDQGGLGRRPLPNAVGSKQPRRILSCSRPYIVLRVRPYAPTNASVVGRRDELGEGSWMREGWMDGWMNGWI